MILLFGQSILGIQICNLFHLLTILLFRYQKELEAWTRKTERDGTASAIEALQTKVAALKKRSKEAKV